MRALKGSAIAAAASFCLIGVASAADMTGAEIKELISGKTVYQELVNSITGSSGPGIIYYDANGTLLYKTPKGEMWHGTWSIKDNTACTDWKERPGNPCTRYDKSGDTITTFNVATGQVRAKVTKIVAGNPEKLAP